MRLRIPYLHTKKGITDTAGHEKSILEDKWSTFICLVGIFIIAFFLRSYFALELSTKYGTPFLLTGGSDAYYYERILEYIAFNNRHLLYDPMINFPMGVRNPRPPFYSWTTVLSAHLFSPFVGGLSRSLHYSLILSTAFWGALTIFPTYLVGRDIFGKRAGIAAAFLLAISAGHLQRSPIGNADHDAIYLFFAISGFYFLMKALKGIPDEVTWVEKWGKLSDIKSGMSSFIGNNKKSLLYASMAGMCFATVALSWQGWAYVVVIVLTYYYIQLFIDRVRYRDSTGVTFCIMLSLVVCVLVAAPFYYGADVGTNLPHGIGTWFDVPLIIIILGLIGGFFLTITRDFPWVLVFSALIIIVVGVLLYAIYISPALMEMMLSGAGYFARTKTYETIAEAQAPEFSNIVLSFGPASFFLSMIGIALAIWHFKGRWDTQFLFILVWTAFAIYMSLSAARFIFNGSPAFALTAGWVVALLVEKSKFHDITYRLARSRGNLFRGVKKAVTVTHVISVLFVVFILLLPNVMSGLDAGIPFERKREYDRQVYQTIPNFMRPDDYNETQGEMWHFGAFGYGLDKPTDYWPSAWDWLKEENSHLPPEERPAFLSWWDYGFESVARGKTPTVADNFLWGHQLAGNVLMAQNESEVLSLMIVRMLEAPFREDGALEGRIREILVEHIGEEKTQDIEDALRDPAAYRDEVLSDPDRYHPRADDISNANLRYARTMGLLAYEKHDTLVELYYEITTHMDKIIQHIAVDTRLFPFSGRQTGIFYAPAKLSDHRIDEEGGMRTPYDFFTIYLIDEFGNEYEDPEDVPMDVTIVDYDIRYQPMFYNSMLYRTFVGYAGHWVGEEEGVPVVDNEQLQPMPGWGLNNFKMSYKTAYYNPYPQDEVRDHPDEWRAVSFKEAMRYQEEGNGTVDLSAMSSMSQGVVFLEYYHGAIVSGKVALEDGSPIAGARVTVLDEMGTPHETTLTDDEGHYSAYAPQGEITVAISTGGMEMPVQQLEETTLGFSSFTVTKDQAMRKRVDRTGDGRWDYLIQEDFEVETSSIEGHIYIDEDDDGAYTQGEDTLVPGEITIVNDDLGIERSVESEDGSFYVFNIAPGNYNISTDIEGTSPSDFSVEPGETITKDILVSTGSIEGYVTFYEDVIEDIELEVKHTVSGNIHSLVIDQEGNYSLTHLSPGIYEMEVVNNEFTVAESKHLFNVIPDDKLVSNITITRAFTVDGLALQNGKPIPYQKLSFTPITDPVAFPRTVTSDKDGEFRVKLPVGDYRVYGSYHKNQDKFVYIDTINLPYEEESLTVVFRDAHRITGIVEYDGTPTEEFQIFFSDDEGHEALVFTNMQGEYSVLLPKGDYSVYGMNIFETDILYRSRISVDGDADMDMEAQPGFKLEGVIYRDLNHDGEFDTGEGISAHITATFDDGFSMTIPSQRNGKYSLIIPYEEDVTLSYNKEGFLSKEYSIPKDVSIPEHIPMLADNITLSGDIQFEALDIPDVLPIVFKPVGEGAQYKEAEISGESYSISLQPGDYMISIDHPYGYGEKYYLSEEISLDPGIDKDFPLEVEHKVSLTGIIQNELGDAVEAQIHLRGPEDMMMYVNDTFEVYLKTGTYTLWADYSEQELVNISTIHINSPRTVNITLESGVTFSPFITYDGEPKNDIPVLIECLETGYLLNKTTDIEGTFTVLLPPRSYEVSVDHKIQEPVEGILREVHYYYNEVYEMLTSTAPAIPLGREFVNATLTGTVRIGGQGVGNLLLEFVDNSPDAMPTSTVTDNDGNFNLKLSQGLYTIYASYNGPKGLYAVFTEFLMSDEDDDLTISLDKGVVLTGTVKRAGETTEAEISIRSLDKTGRREFSTDENGIYEIILPLGHYGIIASTTEVVDNVETDYRYARELDLKYSMELDLNLEVLKIYGVQFDDVDPKTADQGESLEFILQVENTGNTKDAYTFSAPTAIWDLEFEPSRLDVPAGKTRDLKVIVHIHEDASVNHPPISFMAESVNSDETAEMTLPINVVQHYGVNLESTITKRQLDRGRIIYSLTVENTGNGNDIYDIKVLNKEHLRIEGWNVSVTPTMDKITDGGTSEISVTLIPIRSNPNTNVDIKIEATSQGNPSIYDTETFNIQKPSLLSDLHGLNLIGEDISLKRDVFHLKTWHWALLAAVAVIGGLYFVRKKRWI